MAASGTASRSVYVAVLVPAGVVVAIAGYVFGFFSVVGETGFDDDAASVALDVFFAVWAAAMFLLIFAAPFAIIAAFLVNGRVGSRAAVIAFVVGAVALVAVPWLVQKSIEGDESSTAGLIHIWDPLLVALAILAALGIAMGLHSRRSP